MPVWVSFEDIKRERHYVKTSEVTLMQISDNLLTLWYGKDFYTVALQDRASAKAVADIIAEIENGSIT